MDFPASKFLGKNFFFFFNFEVMPTQKNSIQQISLEHLQRAERHKTGMLLSRIQETHGPDGDRDANLPLGR